MNHWGIGRIDSRGGITLPESVLRPISMSTDCMIWGMFYPVSQTEETHTKEPMLDFVFSAIPYKIWPKSARCIVRVSHLPGAFNQVTEALMKCNASIIISDASRSAHSYDTWRLIISCDNLDTSPSNYQAGRRQYGGMDVELEKIKQTIEEICSDVLFYDPCDKTKQNAVGLTPHNAMAYFYAISQTSSLVDFKGLFKEWAICEPFIMRRDRDGVIRPRDNLFSAIMEDLNKSKENSVMPAYCFAESQSDDMNMRLVVISQNHENRFYKLNVGFHRSGPPATSKGIVDFTLRRICENANVWAVNNKTMLFDEFREEGESEFLVEGVSLKDNEERIRSLKKKINRGGLPPYLNSITKITVTTESLSRAFLSQNTSREAGVVKKNDIFISYSASDSDEARRLQEFVSGQGLDCFLSEKKDGKSPIKYGSDYRDALRDEITTSKAVLLICSPDSMNSKWVLRELGAAWALGMKVIPVVLKMKIEEIVEESIAYNQAIYFHEAIDNMQFVEDVRDVVNES